MSEPLHDIVGPIPPPQLGCNGEPASLIHVPVGDLEGLLGVGLQEGPAGPEPMPAEACTPYGDYGFGPPAGLE